MLLKLHVYFDKDASGTYKYSYEEEECYPEKGIDRVKPFVEWIKQNKFHGFIGEYGIPDNDPRWNETLDLFLGYLQENGINGTYWAAVRGGIPISWQSPPKTEKTDRKCLSLRNIQVP